MSPKSRRRFEEWYLSQTVPVLAFIGSLFVLLGGVYLLSGELPEEEIEFDGISLNLVVVLVLMVCSLIWLLLTQLGHLRKSQQNLRLTLESSTDIVILMDGNACYVEIFATAEQELAVSPDELRGVHVSRVLGPEVGARVEKVIKEVLATGKKQSTRYPLVMGGVESWFEATISPRDSEVVVAMIRDVTREQELQKEVEIQSRFMEDILNAISDPIFMKDQQHRWLYGNDAFSRMLGVPRDQYYGKTDKDLFLAEHAESFFQSDRETFEANTEVEIEEDIVVNGSGQRTILTKKTPLKGRDGKPALVGIIRDITDRKQMERDLQDERARQVSSARLASLGEMAGGVAHEINNPLAIISGYAGRLKDVLSTEPLARERAIEITQKIDNTANRIATIVKGLRAISRDGSFDSKERASVETIVNETLGLCSERFRAQGVAIQASVDPNLYLLCRPVQISQVLLNLLTNAFFAVSKLPNASIEVVGRKVDGGLEISVTDSGPGISQNIRERIFEPFFTTKPVGVGTGLGLSIAASIIREHDGELSLDDKSEKTRFVIRLPAA